MTPHGCTKKFGAKCTDRLVVAKMAPQQLISVLLENSYKHKPELNHTFCSYTV